MRGTGDESETRSEGCSPVVGRIGPIGGSADPVAGAFARAGGARGGADFADAVLRRVEAVRPFVAPRHRRLVKLARAGVAVMLSVVVTGACVAWWQSPLRERSAPVTAVVRSAEAGIASGLRQLSGVWNDLTPAGVPLTAGGDLLVAAPGATASRPMTWSLPPTLAGPAGSVPRMAVLMARVEPERLAEVLGLGRGGAAGGQADPRDGGFLIDPAWDPTAAGSVPR